MEKWFRFQVRILTAFLVLGLYLAGGRVAMKQYELDWTYVDAVYFVMATLSTVGYGDLSPSTGNARLITLGIMFIGVFMVFPIVATTIGGLVAPITSKGRTLLDRLVPPQTIDIDGDGWHVASRLVCPLARRGRSGPVCTG